jgi:hypothetical protein
MLAGFRMQEPIQMNADVPYRFVPCMVSGLAYYLSQKFNPQLTQQLKLLYEDELQRALQEDGSSSSSFITPKNLLSKCLIYQKENMHNLFQIEVRNGFSL